MLRYVLVIVVAVLFMAVNSPIANAAGPGEGEMTKYGVYVGEGCTVDSLTVKWDLDSLLGEPTVKGNYKYSGDCGPAVGFVIWLRVEFGGAWGFVRIAPAIPNRPESWGFNTTGSPNWDEALCGYDGAQTTQCMRSSVAKEVWKNGRVTDFSVPWDPEEY